MIDFAILNGFPHEPDGIVGVRLHGRIIGTVSPAADGQSAYVCIGLGLDSEGGGHVYARDRFGRPECLYRAAAELILKEGGYAERIAS